MNLTDIELAGLRLQSVALANRPNNSIDEVLDAAELIFDFVTGLDQPLEDADEPSTPPNPNTYDSSGAEAGIQASFTQSFRGDANCSGCAPQAAYIPVEDLDFESAVKRYHAEKAMSAEKRDREVLLAKLFSGNPFIVEVGVDGIARAYVEAGTVHVDEDINFGG
jgi:hypothetical protein